MRCYHGISIDRKIIITSARQCPRPAKAVNAEGVFWSVVRCPACRLRVLEVGHDYPLSGAASSLPGYRVKAFQ